jgi:glycine oxidase
MKIIIIGGGVAGLAIGWRLAEAGQEVTVLERSQPGGGATGASAGMLAVTAELQDASLEEMEFSRYSNVLWPSFAEKLEAVSGRKINYAAKGALLLADDAAALSRLSRQAGPGRVLLEPPQVRALVPLVAADGIAGGLWSASEAQVDNRSLGPALAVALQKAGGRILANEAAVRLERERDGRVIGVQTPFGRHAADAVILAAGAWSGLLDKAGEPVSPVKGQMILLAPPAGETVPGPVIWGGGIYAVSRAEGLAIGATMEDAGFDTTVTPQAREMLLRSAEKLMPALGRWTLIEHWAGLRPRAPDGLPMLGPTRSEGLWLAGGQYRNGILFAPAVAETVADQILGRASPIAAFDPRRFGT